MSNIFKVNTNNANIYICVYCHSYIESNKNKSILIKQLTTEKNIKCYICNRYIIEINTGPNIINYITQNISNNNLLLNIAKYKIWYFNDIYDNFGYYLRHRFNFTHQQIKNIYQAINELYALPNINIINEKSNYIYDKYITVK